MFMTRKRSETVVRSEGVHVTREALEAGRSLNAGHTWLQVTALMPARFAAERIKGYWTTMGVVAALLATMAFAGLLTPTLPAEGVRGPAHPVVAHVYASFMAASLALELFTVMMCTILYSKLNQMPRDEDVRWFFVRFSFFLRGPILPFSVGAVLLCAATAVGIHSLFGLPATLVFAVSVVGAAAALIFQHLRMTLVLRDYMTRRVEQMVEEVHATEMAQTSGGSAPGTAADGSDELDV
eukprot:TRINITY_DN3540_c0_g1_i3.p1 TRINITY_DN3540_c0_g1~~TRINITY_DN3540_c0_g1_i3.p1  ORF type:complete len:239 (+),score=69.16 TRINITY_DN3540_c0_g1_i3:919-1635(+)